MGVSTLKEAKKEKAESIEAEEKTEEGVSKEEEVVTEEAEVNTEEEGAKIEEKEESIEEEANTEAEVKVEVAEEGVSIVLRQLQVKKERIPQCRKEREIFQTCRSQRLTGREETISIMEITLNTPLIREVEGGSQEVHIRKAMEEGAMELTKMKFKCKLKEWLEKKEKKLLRVMILRENTRKKKLKAQK